MGRLNRRIARFFGYDLMRYEKSFRFEATLDRLLKIGGFDAILDIGANEGWFSGHCLKALQAPCYAFEPAAHLAEALRKTAKGKLNWHIVQAALGDREETAQLNISGGSGVYNSLNAANPDFAATLSELNFVAAEEVQVTTLDSFTEKNGLNKFSNLLIKIDTQGHDFKVLSGGINTIGRARVVIIELPFQNIYSSADTYKDIMSFMDDAGFDIYSLSPISSDKDGRLVEADGFFIRR